MPEYEEQPALLPEQLDAYVTALLDDAPPTASGPDEQVVQDLITLSHTTPMRPAFADELRTRLLSGAAAVNQSQAATKDAPLWGVFTSRGGAPAGQQRRTNPIFTFGLAGAAIVLLMVVLGVAFFRTSVNVVGAASILSKVKAVAQDSAASGLRSFHGTISGWDRAGVSNSVFTQTWHTDLTYSAPDKLHSIFWVVPYDPQLAVQLTPAPDADTVEKAVFNITLNGKSGVNWQESQHTAYMIAESNTGNGGTSPIIYSGLAKETRLSDVPDNATVKELGEGTIAGRKVYIVEASPTADGTGALTAWIDAQTYMQLASDYRDSSGTTKTHWEFTSYEPNITVALDQFSFAPPAGATQIWQRTMTFDEQVQRWRQIAMWVANGTAFQVYMPAYTPTDTQPAGPRVLGEPAAGVTMDYHTGVNYEVALTINEGLLATMNADWSHGQPVQLGELSGYYIEGDTRTLALDSKEGTRIVLNGTISKEELLKVGGSLQRVGQGQIPTEITPLPAAMGSPQPTATAFPGAVATDPALVATRQPTAIIPLSYTIGLRPVEVLDASGKVVPPTAADLAAIHDVLVKRLAVMGARNPQIDLQSDGTITVRYEASSDNNWPVKVLLNVGLLEWIAPQGDYLPEGSLICTTSGCHDGGVQANNLRPDGKPYEVVIGADDIDGKSAYVTRGQSPDSVELDLKLTEAGASKMAALTNANVGKYMALVLDNVVLFSAIIQAPTTGDEFMISVTDESTARNIEVLLKSGRLPLQLELISDNVVPLVTPTP